MDKILDKIKQKNEEEFELGLALSCVEIMNNSGAYTDEEHLPFLFRELHSLAPQWHGFCMQLDVKGLDKIEGNGTDVDDCLALGLQRWLNGDKTSWKQLITAIFQPAGGRNQLLALQLATSCSGILR